MADNQPKQDFSGYLFDVPTAPRAPRVPRPASVAAKDSRVEEVTAFLQLGSAECDISIARFHEWGTKPWKWTVYPIEQRPEGFLACDRDGKWCKKPSTKPRWDENAINDPRRPDWGIFAELLKRPLQVPIDKGDARWALKQAIIDAYQMDGGHSLMAACAPRQLAGFQKEFSNGEEAIDLLSQRLLNISAQATPSNAKKIKDPTQGNSNYCLHYWEPTKGGVVQYVAFRLGAIISDIVEERMNEPKTVSLNVLAEKNVEVTAGGTLIHSDSFGGDEVDGSEYAIMNPSASKGKKAARDRHLSGGARPLMRPEWKRRDSPEQLASKGRSDFDYFSVLSGTKIKAAKTPEARVLQVRELAQGVIESVLPSLDPDDQAAIREDLADWDPARDTFTTHFPDVAEAAFKARFTDPIEADVQAAANAVMGYGDAPGIEATRAEHIAFASEQIRESSVWLARANLEDLNDASRPDYQFFCERMQEEPDEDLRGEGLHKRVKEMAIKWTGLTLQNQPHGPYVLRRVRDWDPGKDGYYHEMIQEMLGTRPRALMEALKPGKPVLAREKAADELDLSEGEPAPTASLALDLGDDIHA